MPTLIDPQQIYPKRIGRHRQGLVIEYYNLDKDCFKRHLIPYDDTESIDKTIENILKNPKHSVFLRKVAPHHIKAAISGQKFDILPQNINEKSKQNSHSYQNSSDNDYSKYKTDSNINTSSIPSSQNSRDYSSNPTSKSQTSYQPSNQWKKKKDLDQSGSYNLSTSKISNGKLGDKAKGFSNLQDSHGYSMNFDQESMNISVVPNKDIELHQHVVQQEIEYQEDFQQLSTDKKQLEEKLQRQKEQQAKKMQIQRKKKEKEQKKKKQKQKQKQKQKNDMDFDFLDDQQPKKKKKKKDKSKSKDKDNKKQSKKEQTPIQDDFDFI